MTPNEALKIFAQDVRPNDTAEQKEAYTEAIQTLRQAEKDGFILVNERKYKQLKVAFFGVIRNSIVMPGEMRMGIYKGKKYANEVAVKTMKKIINDGLINYDAMSKSYEEGGGNY